MTKLSNHGPLLPIAVYAVKNSGCEANERRTLRSANVRLYTLRDCEQMDIVRFFSKLLEIEKVNSSQGPLLSLAGSNFPRLQF